MEFGILGPLRVIDRGQALEIGGLKQRALLAMLVLEANRAVPPHRLIDALWEDDPPATAAKALQVYVAGLRKVVGRDRLETTGGGYRLRVEEGELDLHRFERLVREGRLEDALELWRGPPLADFPGSRFAQSEIARLEERHLACLEQRIEHDLADGRHGEVIAELEALVEQHPLRELLRCQLMLALYRAGRQAEALAAYQDARGALVAQLGIEPGRALRELERAILNQDASLDLPAPVEPAPVREGEGEAPVPPPAMQERRVVTVLFADLVGFTERAERLDPEDARELLSRWYGCARAEMERYGGSVDKFVGDAVMGLFGVPTARGDDAERAVRAALALREAVRGLNADDPELDLRFRIGVNTGEAVVMPRARLREGEGMVVGDVVNTASRLQSLAQAGGILVGEETYRATRSTIRYEDAQPRRARGKRAPVRAWAALGAVEAEVTHPHPAAFVGRERELQLLRDVWRRVLDERRPHLVTILAPPGVGKTRLADEFARLVAAAGNRAVAGRSLPYAESPGQGPFARQVKRVAGIFESDALPTAIDKLEQIVAELLGREHVGEVAPPLAVLVGLAHPETLPDRQTAFHAARRFAEGLAADRPTVLVCEDLHWSDPVQLELIAHLASRVRDVPLLLLALARPELTELYPTWAAGVPASTIVALEPLPPEDSFALASQLLERDPSVHALAGWLAARAEGNPLFLEELAAALLAGGTASADSLPTTVRAIIASRLDALPADERAVLLDASVVGKVFWRGAVAELRGSDGRLSELLDSLEGRDLIRREASSRIEREHEFRFKHMLIRDVAYATLVRAARRERHAAAAAFLERALGDRVGEWAALLGHHLQEAGDQAGELRFVLLEAERAWPTTAARLYQRALELIPDGDADLRRRVRLDHALALVHASRFDSAADELDELIPELAGRDLCEALRFRARAAFWLGDTERASRFADRAAALAEELKDGQLQALVRSFLVTLRSAEGDVEEGRRLAEAAIAAWTPASHPVELAEAVTWLSLTSYWLGSYESALANALRARELARETHAVPPPETAAELGLALAGLGRHEEAIAVFREADEQALEYGVAPRWRARHLNMWAGTLRELGDAAGARRLNEEAIEVASANAFPPAVESGEIDLLYADLAAGEVGRAEAAWPRLWQTAREASGWHAWLWLTRLEAARAEIELARGRPEEAAAAATDALARAVRHGRRKYAISSRLALGAALAALGRPDEAVEALRRALAEAERLGHPPSIIRAAALLARGSLAAGDERAAEKAYERAEQMLTSFSAGLSDERRAQFLTTPTAEAALALSRHG